MLTQLIDHNDDLKRLKSEGYNMSITKNNLVIDNIPYVTSEKKIDFGAIFCPIRLLGTKLLPPSDHTVYFTGSHPCDQFGEPVKSYVNQKRDYRLTDEIIGKYYFSSKPSSGYPDFYSKMTRYVGLLIGPAISLDSSVSATNFDADFYIEESVFSIPDTSTARSEISDVARKVNNQKIAIAGLGGTGSYVLDHVAKSHVNKITIIDGDTMENHNVFRMPGVATLDEIRQGISKVEFYHRKYSDFRSGVEKYDEFLKYENLDILSNHDFVFLCIDNASAKKVIIDFLLQEKIPFVDLGMGLSKVGEAIRGQIRTTLVTPQNQEHLNKINMCNPTENDIYSTNIQVSELNALNAIYGIICWKKYFGFYSSDDLVYNMNYVIDTGDLIV